MLHSLTTKLVFAFLAVTVVGVLLVAFFIGRQTEQAFNRFLLDRNQGQVVDALTAFYSANGSWDGLDEVRVQPARPDVPPRRDRAFWGIVTDAEGRFVFPADLRDRAPVGERALRRAVPIRAGSDRTETGEVVGYVFFEARPGPSSLETPESIFIGRLWRAVMLGAAVATMIALLVGMILARTITRPILVLTDATRTVAAGALGHQVAVNSRDEIGELAQAFNRMSSGLDQSIRQRRQMTADIAHDLRTPLSIILGYTEALNDGKLAGSPEIFTTVHREASHLNHLIDDLRTLSLADAGELTLQKVTVAPADLLARAAAAHLVHAEERSIGLTVQAADDLPAVAVDQVRLAQVLNNLVSNALRHTPDGGSVSLGASAAAESILLTVADTGAGIDPADLPYIFDRFYRGDKSRAGNGESGLGLPIVRSIVEAHSGTVTAANTAGGGATFTVVLPIASPA